MTLEHVHKRLLLIQLFDTQEEKDAAILRLCFDVLEAIRDGSDIPRLLANEVMLTGFIPRV